MGLFRLLRRPKARAASTWQRIPHAPASSSGRRYVPGVTYVLPKDLPEASRLDFPHYLLHAVLHSDYATPIDPQIDSILDVATGTGRWAIEMAHAFPHAHVVGLDMEAPLRQPVSLPQNYHFIQGNLFAGRPFSDASFSFVHQRFLVLALPAKQWPFVVSELLRVTRPGGFVELVEGGSTFLQRVPHTKQLQSWWGKASQHSGIDVSLMARLPSLLQHAGMISIHAQTYRVPVGSWGGRVGAMLKQDILASLPAIKDFVCQHAAVTPEIFEATVAALSKEWEQQHTLYEYYVAYGQRRGSYD